MNRAAVNYPDARADAGVEGNGRLTAMNGMLLVVLLAAEGLTLISVGRLISWHVYLGVLLVGPVLLKCASTGYRVARYYLGSEPYVRRGPPHVVLRVLGPAVIVSTLALLGTGIGLIYAGPAHRQPLLTLHQASFIVWLAVMTLHVLGHVFEATRATWRELRDPATSSTTRRRRWRITAVVASLVAGIGLASALYPSAHAWTSASQARQDDR